MEKIALKRWADPVTVPEEIKRMAAEYEEQGYKCKVELCELVLMLDDGLVCIYWEDGVFYQSVQTYEEFWDKLTK